MTTQRLMLILSLGALLAINAPTLLAAGPPEKKDSQVSLVRPDPAPDANAQGTLRIRSHGNGERFDVRVQKVDTSQAHDLFIEDPLDSDTFTFIATLDTSSNTLKYSLNTKHGDVLPLGAASLDELIGRRVEVRVGADVVLKGTVPPWGLSKKPVKATAEVTAPDGAPAPDMSAKLSLRSKADKGQERIDLKAKNVPWADSGPFHVFVEDPSGSDTFENVGDLDKTGDHEGRYRRDTKHGEDLPLSVGFVTELAGRTIEVRDGSGTVFLRGEIPLVQ